MFWGIIDRFVGKYAVIELADGSGMLDVPRAVLPKGVRASDCLDIEGDVFIVNSSLTVKRRAENLELQKQLFQ